MNCSSVFHFLFLLLVSPLNASYTGSDLNRLDRRIRGNVLARDTNSPEYNEARQIFFLNFDKFPSVIIECFTASDVRKALQFALDHDQEFVVRSGGHSAEGYSTCNDCIVINLVYLNGISISERKVDDADGVVSLEPGLLVNQVARFLEDGFAPDGRTRQLKKKYWTPLGLDNVGIGGHIHGGGWGWGMRKHGMPIDNLIQVKMIIVKKMKSGKARARMVTADANRNSDLFFCVRGTVGPACGIVVLYKVKVYEQPQQFGLVTWITIGTTATFAQDLDRATVVEDGLSDQRTHGTLTSHFPDESGGVVSVTTSLFFDSEFGDITVDTQAYYDSLTNEITSLGGITVFQDIVYGSFWFARCAYNRSPNIDLCYDERFLNNITTPSIGVVGSGWNVGSIGEYEKFVNGSGYGVLLGGSFGCPATADRCGWYLSTWGGKMTDVAADATAFPHRESKFDIIVLAIYDFAVNGAALDVEGWLNVTLYDSLFKTGLTTNRVYCNYLRNSFAENDAYLQFYYANNLERLIDIKCDRDPDNYFTNRQGLPTDTCS